MGNDLENTCFACGAHKHMVDLKRCGRCTSALYCNATCQKNDWPEHKRFCHPVEGNWSDKYRACQDGSMHQGRLELVTWTSHPDADGERTGFAAVVLSEVEDVKKIFKNKFKGDEEKFFKWRPAAFRWTCCGLDAQRNYGCDHHDVRYPQPCTCDFCIMAQPLPDEVYYERDVYRKNLRLARGPDPRSFDARKAAIAVIQRGKLGLPM